MHLPCTYGVIGSSPISPTINYVNNSFLFLEKIIKIKKEKLILLDNILFLGDVLNA